jgi:hypothetical protein
MLRPNGIAGINMQVGRSSEVVDYDGDRRFFEYYRNGDEIAHLMGAAGFRVVGFDYGETARNTHNVDITLKWATVYAQGSAC